MKHVCAVLFACTLLLMPSLAARAQGPGGHGGGGGHGAGGPGPRPDGGGFGGGLGDGGPRGGGRGNADAPRGSLRTSTGIKLGPPGRWWDDRSVSSTIGLRKDQRKKMDAIFDANKPALISAYQNFQQQQANLNTVSTSPQVDKDKMFAAIDSVSQARNSLEKAYTEMLLQIRQQLEPDQMAKLDHLP